MPRPASIRPGTRFSGMAFIAGKTVALRRRLRRSHVLGFFGRAPPVPRRHGGLRRCAFPGARTGVVRTRAAADAAVLCEAPRPAGKDGRRRRGRDPRSGHPAGHAVRAREDRRNLPGFARPSSQPGPGRCDEMVRRSARRWRPGGHGSGHPVRTEAPRQRGSWIGTRSERSFIGAQGSHAATPTPHGWPQPGRRQKITKTLPPRSRRYVVREARAGGGAVPTVVLEGVQHPEAPADGRPCSVCISRQVRLRLATSSRAATARGVPAPGRHAGRTRDDRH